MLNVRTNDIASEKIKNKKMGPNSVLYSMHTEGVYHETKRLVHVNDHLLPTSVEVQNKLSYNSTLSYAFLAYIEKNII
jgi:hypothetical protein